MYTGILLMELGQFLQKQHMHGGVTGPYGNSAGLKASVPFYLLLSQSKLLKGYGDTIVEPFSFGSKSDPAVRTDKELAAKLAELKLSIGAKTSSTGKIFGSVNNIMISEALAAQGFDIDRKKILLKDIKEVGTYSAVIKLHREVKVEVPFEVVSE